MRLLFITLIVTMLAAPASAHQCILGGSSASDIQIYNSCKSDLASGTAGHEDAGHEDAGKDLSADILRLQAENEALKARLTAVKRRLLDILGDL